MVTVNIPEFWDFQRELIYAPERFIWLKGGRRSSKSTASMFRQGLFACQNPGTHNWTVERTWGHARRWYRWARIYLLPRNAVRYKSDSDLRIELVNGSDWEFRSADKPDSLRGEGLHSLVGHEAAFWTRYAWDTLRPALSDNRGWALLNSTPKGLQNYFAEEWLRAQASLGIGQIEWEASARAFDWPTVLNPKISKFDIDAARRSMPDAMFRQEYLGEFVSDAGSLFRPLPVVWTGAFEEYAQRGRYVAGYDLAKRRDYTAWVILRVDVVPWRVVDFGRMQQVGYVEQSQILNRIFRKWYVRIAMADQYQETVYELLDGYGVPVQIYELNATSRPTLLNNLAVVLEQGQIRIPCQAQESDRQRECDVMRGEVSNFIPAVSRRGNVRYEAADGYHDDYVFALANAVEAGKQIVDISGNKGGGPFMAVGGKIVR